MVLGSISSLRPRIGPPAEARGDFGAVRELVAEMAGNMCASLAAMRDEINMIKALCQKNTEAATRVERVVDTPVASRPRAFTNAGQASNRNISQARERSEIGRITSQNGGPT